MDKVANSGNDEFYTPSYAVEPILKYVPDGAVVWCPFDTEESCFVKMLRGIGRRVIATHLDDGQDFFEYAPSEHYDFVISNPPYSMKGDVLKRLFSLRAKFAMLVGVVGLFESKARFSMFKENEFDIMYLSKRVAFFKNFDDPKPSIHPPFSSVYVSHGMFPDRIVFSEIQK